MRSPSKSFAALAAFMALLCSACPDGSKGDGQVYAKAPSFYWGWWYLFRVGDSSDFTIPDSSVALEKRTPFFFLVAEDEAVGINSSGEFESRIPALDAPSWPFVSASASAIQTKYFSIRKLGDSSELAELVIGSGEWTIVRATSERGSGGLSGLLKAIGSPAKAL